MLSQTETDRQTDRQTQGKLAGILLTVRWGEYSTPSIPLRATTWVCHEAEREGKCGQAPLLWFLREEKGQTGQAGLRLTGSLGSSRSLELL